jgi:UDP-glucose:(heptosyl)LPS alpha-1,3-glucosyltransferase
MRIALLTRRFDPGGGGTERDLSVTARCLREAGHRVTVYAAEVRAASDSFPVVRIGVPAVGRAAAMLAFAYRAPAAARSAGADLVVSFARAVGADVMRSGGGAHASYVRAARRWRNPLAARAMWASPYHRAQMFVERRGFGWSGLKLAIAVSELVRGDLIRQFHLAPEKVATLYNGVDCERLRPAGPGAARAELRARFRVADGAALVLFVGNGFARKGLGFLIEAWRRVEAGANLLVVGADRAARSYQLQAARAGLGDRVHFAGPQPQVERIFQAADALALPSLFEPFGNVVMEAMASGLPVLVSADAGAAELLPDPMRAFIVNDPSNAAEIAERMNALLRARGDLGAVVRATAERYSWSAYSEKLNEMLSAIA